MLEMLEIDFVYKQYMKHICLPLGLVWPLHEQIAVYLRTGLACIIF